MASALEGLKCLHVADDLKGLLQSTGGQWDAGICYSNSPCGKVRDMIDLKIFFSLSGERLVCLANIGNCDSILPVI